MIDYPFIKGDEIQAPDGLNTPSDIEQLFLNSEDDRGIRLLRRLDHAPRHLKIYDVKVRDSVLFCHGSIQYFFQVYEHTSLLSVSGLTANCESLCFMEIA